MFSSLLAAPCEVKLHLLQHVIFLRPPTRRATENSLPTSTDEIARGLVELHVPQDRRIGGIRVKLRAVQSVAILPEQQEMINFSGAQPIGWEDTVLMEKVVDIGLPASKSHATVPGDDSIATERRGRSRQTRSRMVTPVQSRQSSPRISLDDQPPEYQQEHHTHRPPISVAGPSNGVLPSSSTSSFSAIVRAISRGRPSGSRSASRTPSRQQSREASPERSPHMAPISSQVSTPRGTSEEQEEEIDVLSRHLSRTGLSGGRSNASGPHPHAGDRHDYFGVVSTRAANDSERESNTSPAAAQRSTTMSPTRSRNERGSTSLMGRGQRGLRAPSVDAGIRTTSEESTGLFLQKGVHGFEFAFIIPADSAPYERSPYGRVRYVVKAVAFGAGRAKSNIEAWRDMFPVVNPSNDGGPVPLTVLYNDLHSTVGLLSIACTSNNISVGGIFNVDIHSPTPPEDLIVYLVRVSVETTTELRTRKKGKQYVPTQRHKLFEKGWVPPRPNDPHGQGDGKRSEGIIRDPTRKGSRADDAWTVQGVARMPNDNIVRSTTVSGSRASIRFSHQLLVEVVHSRASSPPEKERKLKVFALRQPIVLPSCCVAYDAVVLPPYSAADDNARSSAMPYDVDMQNGNGASIQHASHQTDGPARDPTRPSTASRLSGPGHEFCVCGQSFDDLSERERRLMPMRPYSDLPLDGISHRKIGELPDSGSVLGVGGSIGNALRRSTSRSSSTSRDSRERSLTRRSISSSNRSLSRIRSPSIGSTSGRRGRSSGRGGFGNVVRDSSSHSSIRAGPYANGAGERGEGVIRHMSRGARAQEIPGEAQGHSHNSIAPPAYENVVEEQDETEDAQVGGGGSSAGLDQENGSSIGDGSSNNTSLSPAVETNSVRSSTDNDGVIDKSQKGNV